MPAGERPRRRRLDGPGRRRGRAATPAPSRGRSRVAHQFSAPRRPWACRLRRSFSLALLSIWRMRSRREAQRLPDLLQRLAAPRRRGRSACGSPRAPSRPARPPWRGSAPRRRLHQLQLDGGHGVLLQGVAQLQVAVLAHGGRERQVVARDLAAASRPPPPSAPSSRPAPPWWAAAPARRPAARARCPPWRSGRRASGAGGTRGGARRARGRWPAAPTTPRRR